MPVAGHLGSVAAAVDDFGADTVAVLACPEMDGRHLRELAWELEKTGTDLCVAPALLDIAGPRTTIRPVAGLPLLHVDHPELEGGKQVVKALFDKVVAGSALIMLAPLFAAIALAITSADRGPVFFRQIGSARTAASSLSTNSGPWWWTRNSARRCSPPRTRPPGCCSRSAGTHGSPGRAHGCGAGRSTSSRS